jgi:hypothetical protein
MVANAAIDTATTLRIISCVYEETTDLMRQLQKGRRQVRILTRMTPHRHDCINAVASGDLTNQVDVCVVIVVCPPWNIDDFVGHSNVLRIRPHIFRSRHNNKLNLQWQDYIRWVLVWLSYFI